MAFDKVSREVVWWALGQVTLDNWPATGDNEMMQWFMEVKHLLILAYGM